MTRLYLYPLWVRIWHWLNAVVFLLAIISGMSMHFAGGAMLMTFADAVALHNAVGMLLSLSWLCFLIGNLVSQNGRFYRLRLATLARDVYGQTRWYVYGIFRDEPPPFVVSAGDKMNALQKLSYWLVLLLLMPLVIGSGWAFFLAPQLPQTLFGMGGVWLVAMIHLAAAWSLILFLLVHAYVITIGETTGANLSAMLTGWQDVSRRLQGSSDDGTSAAGGSPATRRIPRDEADKIPS